MVSKKPWMTVSVYSAAHFLVDFSCAIIVFRSGANASDRLVCLLLYNFCAFAMQMPLGIVADRVNRNRLFAAGGCLVVGMAYGVTAIPVASAVVAGLGNGLFHIGGGIDVLNISGEKSGALGVFVSPGAFGVYFGTILGKGGPSWAAPILLSLAITSAAILFLCRAAPGNAAFSLGGGYGGRRLVLIGALVLFLVVCLRSYVGLAADFPWKGEWHWGIALVCAAALGKTAGGFVADRLGKVRAGALFLGLAAVLFFFPQFPATGVGMVLFMNMTMPVTLWLMAKLFPNAKGFAFGALTFALFIGALPLLI